MELAVGDKYNNWTLVEFAHKDKYRNLYWFCRCDCGTAKISQVSKIVSGSTKSCGCLQKKAMTTHGDTNTRTFESWNSMKQRCLNEKCKDYPSYGGRGVKVHKPWIHDYSQFKSDMGERPLKTSIDRIDVNGSYTPENCQWSTRSEQQRNKTNTKRFDWQGKNYTVSELGDMYSLTNKQIMHRLGAGWDLKKTLSTPIRKKT